MSDSVETLQFKIGLSATYFDKKPLYTISINDTELHRSVVDTESDEIFYVGFSHDFLEERTNALNIRLENKSGSDTVIENGAITKDMLLNIKSIEIDDIDLGSLIWSHSTYKPDHPQKFNNQIITELKNCVNLGWNGTYSLAFTSPFYIWLLENI